MRPSAREYNRLLQNVGDLALGVEPPLELVSGNLRLVPQSFWAVIQSIGSEGSASTSGCCQGLPYGWAEIQPTGSGTWELVEGGRNGTPELNPGYELNGNCIEAGSIVRIRPGYQGEFIFDQCCSVCNPLVEIIEEEGSTSQSQSQSSQQQSSTDLCSCLIGEYELNWDIEEQAWTGTVTDACGYDRVISFWCEGDVWNFGVDDDVGPMPDFD
jgi:hypothetical protein